MSLEEWAELRIMDDQERFARTHGKSGGRLTLLALGAAFGLLMVAASVWDFFRRK